MDQRRCHLRGLLILRPIFLHEVYPVKPPKTSEFPLHMIDFVRLDVVRRAEDRSFKIVQ